MKSPLPESFRLVVGELPAPGRLEESDSHPFETVRPVREGYVDREGVKSWYAVWGEHLLGDPGDERGAPAVLDRGDGLHPRRHGVRGA